MNGRAPTGLPAAAPAAVTRREALTRLTGLGLRACGVMAFAAGLKSAKAGGPTEYQVKAAFLFNFVKFTDWPSSAFVNAGAPLVIGVLGQDPFGRALDELVKGEFINKRPLVVERFPAGTDPAACHVLFVSRSEKDRWPGLRESLERKPVLTVSDLDRYCEQGGMVNLALSAIGTVKPEINPAAAHAAGVTISSKLLNLPIVRLVKTER
jgi:hypothetical protein